MHGTDSTVRRRRTSPARSAAVVAVVAGALCLIGLGGCTGPADDPPGASVDPSPLETLVSLAAERLGNGEAAAASKWGTEVRVDDADRVAEVIAGVRSLAGQHAVAPEFAEQVFLDQIDATESIQFSRFAEWKLDPSAAPIEHPDLTDVRSDIDKLTEAMLVQLGEQHYLLTSADCADARDRALRAVTEHRNLDALYERALTRATASYCINAPSPAP